MKIIVRGLPWLHKVSHGYFLARPYFRGTYIREVFLTVFNTETKRSGIGYLFVCTGSIHLALIQDNGEDRGIYEFEQADTLSVIENSPEMLKKILNTTPGGEIHINVKTTYPKPLLNLNNKLLLLCDIQTQSNPGEKSGAVAMYYLNSKDDAVRIGRLVDLITRILTGSYVPVTGKLPGISARLSYINIYTGMVVVPILFIVVFYFLYRMEGPVLPSILILSMIFIMYRSRK